MKSWGRGVRIGCSAAGLLLAGAVGGAGGGCSNPLAGKESDYGGRVPTGRLRDIEPLVIGRFERPAGAPATDPIDLIRGRFEGLAEVELTLEECRAAVLENNLDLRVALIAPTIAAQDVSEEEARFESAFTTRALWRETDAPTSSELADAQAKLALVEPGVRVPLRTGGTATVSLPVSRSETNNPFSTLNPAYQSDLQFSISQPLLRDAGRRTATYSIRIAAYGRQIVEAEAKLEAIRQLAGVDRAYWRLFQAREELGVRQQQIELAQAQLDRAQRFLDAGQGPEIEVIRAQAGVAERLEAILLAQNAVLTRQRELKRIMNIEGLELGTATVVVPGTPPDPVEYEIDPGALAGEAVENRMEMLELELRLAQDASTIDFARNQALPLFTLDYTYTVNGLGDSLSDSFRTTRDNRFEDWQLGLSAEIPLGNEAARARVARAVLTRLQRLSTREARRLSIRQEVLNAIDQIDAGWQRILAARQSVILNTRTLRAEQRQFEVGGSTSTDVLDAASRLAEAQSAEIRALTDYQIAQIDLAFATGTLLGATRVRWDPLDPRRGETLDEAVERGE